MKYIVSLIIAFSMYGSVIAQADAYSQGFKKLMTLSGTTSTLESSMRQIVPILLGSENIPSEVNAKIADVVVAWTNEDVIPALETTYRKHFSLDDINQIIAFYESEVGRKFIEKQSQVATDLMMMVQDTKMQESLMRRISQTFNLSLDQLLTQ